MRRLVLGLLLAAAVPAAKLELVVLTGPHEKRSPPPGRLAARSYARSLAALLRDRAFLEAAAPLLQEISEPVVELRIQFWDDGRLARGEELRVPVRQPDGTDRSEMIAARGGETIATFSRRLGLPEAGLRMVNDTRFDVMPFSLRTAAGVPTIYMGEVGLGRLAASHDLGRRENLVSWTVLHELAHLAAPGDCVAEIADRYGNDWQHWAHEVILPGAAFSEGWADYRAATRLPWFRRRLEASDLPVRFEQVTRMAGSRSIRYRWVPPGQVRPRDRLRTREGVTRLLLALPEALALTGERATREQECRELTGFLRAAAEAGLTAEDLAQALVTSAVASPDQAPAAAAALLAGR